jgi:hypothetical protein
MDRHTSGKVIKHFFFFVTNTLEMNARVLAPGKIFQTQSIICHFTPKDVHSNSLLLPLQANNRAVWKKVSSDEHSSLYFRSIGDE